VQQSLLDILVDPIAKSALTLSTERCAPDGTVIDGQLQNTTNRAYAIVNGIPRFVLTDDQDQRQTELSFAYQWRRREAYDTPRVRDFGRDWLIRRYGFDSIRQMRDYFARRSRILDAGCGSGYTASLWLEPSWRDTGRAEWLGVDISGAIDVAKERLRGIAGTHFIQADILQMPFGEQTFDVVFAEGVLHHTPSTERALKALVPLLSRNGEIMFYVYRKKGPLREFADDYIRGAVAALPAAEAWDVLRPLTKLGRALAGLHAEVEVEEDIPYLGIKAGRFDVQRLVYWNFAKMFWNDELSFDENHHMNFDWYAPRYSFRQTEEEVRRWCAEADLKICRFASEESGYTVRATRN
jgi:SAM-dependent methyltransferase